MNIPSRKPREKDTREVVFDARPYNHVQAVDEMISRFRDPILEPRTESEVMPLEERPIGYDGSAGPVRSHDTSPESATRGDRPSFNPDEWKDFIHEKFPFPGTSISRLDQIASLIRSLTYGEMMDLAAAIWKARPADADGAISLKLETLPGTLHRWSTKEDSKP